MRTSSLFSLPFALLLAVLELPGILASDSLYGETLLRKDQVQAVLEHQPVTYAACKDIPTGPIETTSCDFETIESVTDNLYSHLKELVKTPFFKYYRADLYRECPFWQENGLCMNKECGITTVDEREIPEKWRAAALSKVELPGEETRSLPGCYYRDSDFCFLDDETEGDYVDLTMNPERFTGYAGLSANRIWSSIYNENCFGMSEMSLLKSSNPAAVTLPDTMTDVLREDGNNDNDQCLEKRVYYKIISGLHASISTHICHDFMNATTFEFEPNLQCFVQRVASHPERLQYIYFNTVLMLRAVSRLGPYLSQYDYCSSGTHEDDEYTLEKLNAVLGISNAVGNFDETVLFRGENANVLKEEFKQHFRNVSRIMDCVGCDKCRLWGKIQTSGVGTALKILFELDEKTLDPKSNANLLSRSEVVSLFNTLHRFTESLVYVGDFRRMWADADEEESRELIEEAERAVVGKPRHHLSDGRIEQDLSNLPPWSYLIATLRLRFLRFVDVCRVSAEGCMISFAKTLSDILDTLRVSFSRTNKSQGLHSDL